MDELVGTVAVVTGGGSGIGRALALELASNGVRAVVVADIEVDAARAVADEVEALGQQALAVEVDVAYHRSVEALADTAYDMFGEVNLLCNNAGVLIMAPIADMIVDDWTWLTSVNVMGVVHGVHAFLPRLLAQDSPAHILNTSSVAGFDGGRGVGIYAMTKSAIVSISETLRAELADQGIGVTVLCPANISSRILGSQRNRPADLGRLADEPFGRDLVEYGLDPVHVARRAVRAIRDNELYAFAFPAEWHDRLRQSAQRRFDAILTAIDDGVVGA